MKLGKAPATKDARDIKFGVVVGPEGLKEAPSGFGHWPKVSEAWGMLGNDNWGDCVWAEAAHGTMTWIATSTGAQVAFTDQGVLSDYSAVTGFNPSAGPPGENDTDQGTNMRDAMNYRRKTGVIDGAGNRHKIGAYVALKAGDWAELLEALYVFDQVSIGFEFPAFAMNQFNAGQSWSCQSRNNSIEGGHDVLCVGRPGRSRIKVVTWGALQDMTRCFYERYADEAYGLVSQEALNIGGVTPEGLNLDALNHALAAL